MHELGILPFVACEVAIAAIWIWVMFKGGAEYLGPRFRIVPWSPVVVKVFATLWLIVMTFGLLAVIFYSPPVG